MKESVGVCLERNDHVGESLSKKEGMNNGDQGPLYVLDGIENANEKENFLLCSNINLLNEQFICSLFYHFQNQ